MIELSADPTAGAPATLLLSAAMDADVDLEDEDALKNFLAGWNARGETL